MMNHPRFALRAVWRAPGYSLAFVMTLGLGIGANTAIFSVLNGVLLRPLPYPEADRIMVVQQVARGGGTNNPSFSFVEVEEYRTQTVSFDEVVEYGDWTFNVLGRGEPHVTRAGLVTSNFFQVLGLRPHLGRMLLPADDQRESEPVVVLTYEYWTRVFGADSSVIGQALDLTAKQATIVGVLAPGSHYAAMSAQPGLGGRAGSQDMYANYPTNDHYMSAAMQDERIHRMTDVFARLAPGVSVDHARADAREVAHRLQGEYPESYPAARRYEIVVTPWLEMITEQARPMLIILFGTAFLVLAIACANVANLTLTRLIERERELAIRAALGAGTARLRGQLLAENILLSLAGAALGIVLAVSGLDLLVSYVSRFTSRTGEIGVDGFVLAFTLVIAVGASLLFAWAPRLPISQDLGASLSAAGGGRSTGALSRRRTQWMLAVSQLAMSFMLLVGAGLLVRSLIALSNVDPGFEVENVLTMNVPTFASRTPQQRQDFGNTLVDRVSAHPAVHRAAMASTAPLNGPHVTQMEFQVEGMIDDGDATTPVTQWEVIGPGYFETIGTPVLQGREFTRSDHEESPLVAIINQSMARLYFPDRNPVGRRIRQRFTGGQWTDYHEIVGVVGDTKSAGLDRSGIYAFYLAAGQSYAPSTLLVRTQTDPEPLAGHVMEEVRRLDADRPIVDVQTLASLRDENLAPQRLNAKLFAIFAGLALVIAAVGVVAVLGFSVSERANEFGIRMTLGADQGTVLRMVIREGATMLGVALLIGGFGALMLSRFLSGMLFGIQPTDPVTFLVVAAVLTLVAIGASLAPARTATSVDPMTALRAD